MALAVVVREKKHLQHDSRLTANATTYAEQHACLDFLDPGQATLQVDRTPSSNQPNIFEELSWDELAAVRTPAGHLQLLTLNTEGMVCLENRLCSREANQHPRQK